MEQAIYQAVVSTFEDLGFMFPNEEGEETPRTEGSGQIRVSVSFSGKKNGYVELDMEEGVAQELAENMLCDDVDEEMLLDVAGEAGNVVCGNLLPMIYGEKEVFNLQAPQFVNAVDTSQPKGKSEINFEAGRLVVSFFENA